VIELFRRPAARLLAGGVLFTLIATANGAGYRYGVSDQAFYIPVITHAVHPDAFPRDGAVIDAEGRLMVLDEVIAALVRATGVSLETVFLVGYLVSMVITWTGLVLIGSRVYANPWATAALAALFTLRHRIPQTSANSFEPYFHPRMLAFGVGTLAVAAVLRRRAWIAVGLVAVCAVLHITTALWFAVLIGVALAVLDPRLRVLSIAGAVVAALVLIWAATAGPLQAAVVTMDETWLQAVASKDSLFATLWPAWAWLANLGFLAVLWWAHRWRTRHGLARAEDAALVWGATALVVLFLITLPLVALRWSLAVQFQISRIFWLVDFLAMVYVVAVFAKRARALAMILIAFAVIRGTYIMWVEFPERSMFEVRVPDSPWEDAMAWLRRQPIDVHVLADPGHAWKYGTSVRVSAERDVFLEEVKDSALAIYSRDVAVRVVERTRAIEDFGSMTADRARDLAQRYNLDYLVTTEDVSLPVAYRNQQLRIYSLR
jgi:hypothetical protein